MLGLEISLPSPDTAAAAAAAAPAVVVLTASTNDAGPIDRRLAVLIHFNCDASPILRRIELCLARSRLAMDILVLGINGTDEGDDDGTTTTRADGAEPSAEGAVVVV